MANADKADRPPLHPSDIYRPRLGAQKQPLWRTTMNEVRAWRELSAEVATTAPEQSA